MLNGQDDLMTFCFEIWQEPLTDSDATNAEVKKLDKPSPDGTAVSAPEHWAMKWWNRLKYINIYYIFLLMMYFRQEIYTPI